MRKILPIVLFLLTFTFQVQGQTCGPVPVPFLQSFSTGALPTCWTSQNPTSTSTNANVKWKFSGSAGYGATGNGGKPAGTFAWVDASTPYTGEHTVELISPQINLAGLTNPYVKFEWFKDHLTALNGTVPNADNNELKLAVNNGSGWVQIWSSDTNSPEWRTVGVALAASYAGATIQLRFTVDKDVAGNANFYDDVLLDEVQVMQAPTCFEPTTSPATNIAPTSATLNWTAPLSPAPAPANGYEYYYSTNNTPPTAATIGTPNLGTSANISSLTSGAAYYWWVRSVCSATDKSPWVEGNSFTPGQIGGGTATHAFLPIYSCSGFNYSQQIYMASEVGAAVGTNNYITAIRFFVSTTAATQANYNQWVVYMGNTAQTDFATTTSWIPSSSLTQVYSGTLPAMTAGAWIEIPLSTPFLWDGVSNVVIGVDENSTGTSCTANWGSYSAGNNRGMIYYNTTTNPDPSNLPTATSRYAVLPRVQLTGTTLPSCTNTPPANITVNNITATSANVTWTATANATYVVRYRIPPSLTWQTINITTPFTNSVTLTSLTEQTPYEVEVATICGTQGAFSTPVNFTTPALTYCNSGTATVTNGYINNVTMIGTNVPLTSNNSGPTTYTDYSSDPTKTVTLLRNSTNNTLSVGRSIISGTYSTNAWIDFNGDGIFDNNPSTTPGGERIMNLGYSSTTPVTAVFSVPANAYTGTSKVKMRVIVYSLTPANACASLTSNGEVEDYYVKFIDLQPCTTAPPTNIAVNNLTHNSAYISWIPTSNATYVIRWRQGTTGAWLPNLAGQTLPAGQSFYTINGLTEQTAYQVQISTICNGTQGAFSPSISFTTPPLTYCSMTGTGTNDFISNVKVTPVNFPIMDNTSVQTNYISYTTPATLINLEIGSQGNQLSVSKEWVGTQYADAINAWIDWDRDGVFTDAEKVMTSAASTTTPITATFDVPATVYTGPLTTTMRVVMKRTSAPVMCADAANGEVEDYAVKLRPCSNTTPGNPVFTNITHNSVNINWTAAANNNAFILEYRPVTTPASAWTTLNLSVLGGNPPITINALTPATVYEVRIAAVCGGTGIGTYTPIKTFTTRCDPTPPFVTISNVTSSSAVITWNPVVPSASYILRWREVGSIPWNTPTVPQPPANSYTIQNLDSFKTYEVQVANICIGETAANPWSNPKTFTTERICEIPPPGLTITQITPTTAEVLWDSFPGATYLLKYRKVGIPSWTDVVVSTNTYTITGLLELTKYEMQVSNICNGMPGNFTKLYFFTTPTVIYCPMSAANSTTEFISKVTVKPSGNKEMVNESLASSYSDFTGNPLKFIDLIQGSTGNHITIDKTLSSGTNAGVVIWIDFNRNGEFDISERILADGPNGNPTASTTFSVPQDAFISLTDQKYVVMRVALQKDGIPVNCMSFKDGEVEDYTVRISKTTVPNSLNQTDIHIYPNPVSSVLYVKNISAKAKYKIYSAVGRLISTGIILNNAIDVSNLINGIYIIEIEDGNTTVHKKLIKES
ncbi:fibronectin type III domain-containing protein [Chryseobacterium viscerum]|uniref:fibronectin type III domain-containing protein n=1 Tax=Chryseobacterium viscerum TaxID=1037377 RepID=UPI002221A49B|nr:fibronectin type III domain-containing protein [Chryseobacterium viscerum]MCW1961712.1 fibronectin type III domain-containing protein [Chryseobacterium viscerum]